MSGNVYSYALQMGPWKHDAGGVERGLGFNILIPTLLLPNTIQKILQWLANNRMGVVVIVNAMDFCSHTYFGRKF